MHLPNERFVVRALVACTACVLGMYLESCDCSPSHNPEIVVNVTDASTGARLPGATGVLEPVVAGSAPITLYELPPGFLSDNTEVTYEGDYVLHVTRMGFEPYSAPVHMTRAYGVCNAPLSVDVAMVHTL